MPLCLVLFISACAIDISEKKHEMGAVYHEFIDSGMHSRPLKSIIFPSEAPSDTKTIDYTINLQMNHDSNMPEFIIHPFTNASDGILIQFIDKQHVKVKYMPLINVASHNSALYIHNSWSLCENKNIGQDLDRIEKYAFFLTPAAPPNQFKSIEVHGLGEWSDYNGMIINPDDIPYINRSKMSIYMYNINYIWYIPMAPIIYAYFYIFFHTVHF